MTQVSTRNTGLLTARCDPYGAESQIRLMGGTVDPRHVGRVMWRCEKPAIGRYRMMCRGGSYGQRIAADTGIVAAYICDGGHKGQEMPLCRSHVEEFSSGPPKAGFDASGRPFGRVGGTSANGLCPPCAKPPEARELEERANLLNGMIARYQMLGLIAESAKLMGQLDDIRGELTELFQTGRIHQCPLYLTEVS